MVREVAPPGDSSSARTYRGSFLALFFEGVVCQALDLEGLSRPQEGADSLLLHLQGEGEGGGGGHGGGVEPYLHLAVVHEGEEQP